MYNTFPFFCFSITECFSVLSLLCSSPWKSPRQREGGRLLSLHAAWSRGRREQSVVVRGGQQQRQHGVAGLVVQMEAVAAVTELVGHRQHVGEGRALGKRHRPLENIKASRYEGCDRWTAWTLKSAGVMKPLIFTPLYAADTYWRNPICIFSEERHF